ncbi:HlyD family type I secretion periplasmic adaptor subunit [Pseudodonghicola xiamenensis]|uniref:Membrane fusion protein (MFP) family protein n=1 Tax=Pseudodonghicola xiamenensis TaxID=337702 RepID=A0A8J3H9D1_9RHOB|nr:HlyD family type I secretion periplasmic adaptor subunit [Pseudodonghicola xiamenensis]GHH02203.1 HlyD family type I secretion periplasmic adaptor subunit [Pseudodonghicola xiamenensis]
MDRIKELFAMAATWIGTGWHEISVAWEAVLTGTPGTQELMTILAPAALALLVLTILAVRALRRRPGFRPVTALSQVTRGPRLLGLLAALLFFGGFGAWAFLAPLASAALAVGVVNPDGSRKTVQHLEGGIIKHIHVREGDHVTAGDVLVTLDTVRARARVEELRERLVFLLAAEARLEAELTSAPEINFPEEEMARHSAAPGPLISAQRNLFRTRRDTQASREHILTKRMDQLRTEIGGLQQVIAAQDRQIELLQQELEMTDQLYERGLNRLPQVLGLQRGLASLQADQAQNRATVARLQQQIGETELQLVATRQQGMEDVSSDLAQIRSELASMRSSLPERLDALSRTQILAPISGRVLNLRVTTENGGVLEPGGDILDIVPDDGRLVIDARVRPNDIETVYPGMSARVLLTAYSQRNLPHLYGTVSVVAADRLQDDRTGEPYFLVKVTVTPEDVSALGHDVQILSGMPADVMLLTGERSLARYLFKPMMDSLRLSFRES